MIRLFDILFSFFGLLILSPILAVLMIIGLFDTGKPFFRQVRVGKNKNSFTLIKMRTMHPAAKSVASHLADTSAITKFGHFLRKTKLDELPQLFNVFMGQMSLVGPRPNLFNQTELITERETRGVYAVRPGITGLAQIQNIDMSTPERLAKTDAEMIAQLNIWMYFRLIFLTVFGKGRGDATATQLNKKNEQ